MAESQTDSPVCRACGFTNLPQALFCGGCGLWLNPPDCPHCGTANPGLYEGCYQCGENLAEIDTTASVYGHTDRTPSSLTGNPEASTEALDGTTGTPDGLVASFLATTPFAGSTARLSEHSLALLAIGAAVVILAQVGLVFSLEVNVGAPTGYLLLLAMGTGLFTLGSIGLGMKQTSEPGQLSGKYQQEPKRSPFLSSFNGILGILVGVVAFGALLILLAAGSHSGYLLIPWVLGLVGFLAFFLPRSGLSFSILSFRTAEVLKRHYLDALIVLGLIALFLGIVVSDLRDWYYSAIGDEFLFFEHARRIVEEGVTRPFSQEGVYNKYPVMSSVFQAMSMKAFGADYFGWTLSEALHAAITIPGIYLLGFILHGRKAAVLSAALFAASHYIMAQSHVGYANLSPLPVAVWSIALFAWGWRSNNALLLYLAGVVAGLGFYTHYSGRAVLPVMLLFALTAGNPRRILDLWPLVFGFALAVAPTFLVEKDRVFTRMFSEIVGGYSEIVTGSPLERIIGNIELNLPAFNYNSSVHTYVYGPLFDPATAVLAVLGIAFAVGHLKQQHFRLLLVWFGVALLVTGVLSPYPHVAVTRLTFAVPPLVLLAGVSAAHIVDTCSIPWHRVRRLPTIAISVAAFALLFSGVLTLNLWQLRTVIPEVHPHTPEAVAFGAFRSTSCGGDPSGTVFVGRAVGEGSLMKQMLDSFHPDEPRFRLIGHGEIRPDGGLTDQSLRCVVFLQPSAPEIRPLQEQLTRSYSDGRLQSFTNPSGTTTVHVFVSGQH